MERILNRRSKSANFGIALLVAGIVGRFLVSVTPAQLAPGEKDPPTAEGKARPVKTAETGFSGSNAQKSAGPAAEGGDGGKGKQLAPPETGSDAGKPSVPGGAASRGKDAGENPPETKANELPVPAAGVKDLEKTDGNPLADPGLFDPSLGGNPRIPFRTGKTKAASRFPTWEDPALAERNRAMGLDLLTSPLFVPESEQPPEGSVSAEGIEDTAPLIAPGFFGRVPNVLFPGKGRAAWPWSYRWGIAVINGYDSNGFQVPDNTLTALAQEQAGSFTSGVGLNLDIQYANAHSVFTLSANATGTYYWNRDQDRTLFNIPTWLLLYSTQLGKETRLTLNFSLNYLSQANFSNVYASQYGGGQDFLTTSSQVTVSHRWAQYFSTNTNLAMNFLYYPKGTDNGIALGTGINTSGNQFDITLGNEFRFQTSTKLTWVIDARYQTQEVFDNSTFNSDTLFFLAGLDWIWLRHLTTTVRVGGAFRTSEAFGDSTNPYLEFSGSLRTGRYSSLNLNARYGYNFSNAVGNDAPTFNMGVTYQQTLGRRLSGTAGVNYFRNPSAQPDNSSSSSGAFDLNFGLQYQVDRNFSWGAQYAFTQSDSFSGRQNFSRSLATLSARWNF